MLVDNQTIKVDAAQTLKPIPGHGVIWDSTVGQYRLPKTADEAKQIKGVLMNRLDRVREGGVFEDGEPCDVLMMGFIAVEAGGAVNHLDFIAYSHSDGRWSQIEWPGAIASDQSTVAQVRTAANVVFTDIERKSARAYVDDAATAAAGDLIELAIGY